MKKVLSLGGIFAGALLVIFGIVIMSGGFGSAAYFGSTSPYDSGFASFGGDYYTYSVNNTGEAASAARAVANNLREISNVLTVGGGLFMLCLGLVTVCGFGLVFADCADKFSINAGMLPPVIAYDPMTEFENESEVTDTNDTVENEINEA